ncbi:MAG: KpsF/GutQ family sugar-phosphate isomerase [Legionellaceae bacterium]|nr:KpsF/GutQ family sugar-phosphate isomerase [Legionellaceae bacterium]
MKFCKSALSVIETEAQAIFNLAQRIDTQFEKACTLIMASTGRVIVTGMGKSGHIARKIAATLSSTGTPSFYVHPAEASHGDLGMILPQDIVIALSHSGNTHEVLSLIPLLKRKQISLIAFTGNPVSPLANAADVCLDLSIEQEACPLGLAPTTSTTVALVMGDALAIALLEARGFSADDFALSHPGGSLGRRLLLSVDTLWHDGELLPRVSEDTIIAEALIEVTSKKLGMTCVVDAAGHLAGIFTDGDIRRSLTQKIDINTTRIAEVMTRDCKTIKAGTLAAQALTMMQQHSISTLVVEENNKPLAVVHLQDLLKAGMN